MLFLRFLFSSFVAGILLDALRWNEVKCGVPLSFTDYRIVSYTFMPLVIIGLVSAIKINFGVSRFSLHV